MFAFLPVWTKIYICTVAFLLGAVLGSGLNCLAYRLARGQKWSGGRSACPHCGETLHAADLIPVMSYLLLKGKCRYCGAKLSKRYVLAEGLLGLCYVTLVLRFGLSFDTLSAMVLCGCLLALSLVDLEIQIIPDRLLVIPAVVRLIQLAVEGRLVSGLIPALIFGGGLLLLSLVMDKVLKRDSMGGGDIKLMGMLGLYFSVAECLLLLIVACVAGIAVARSTANEEEGGAFPFGPALAVAAYVTLLAGERTIGWYLSLF